MKKGDACFLLVILLIGILGIAFSLGITAKYHVTPACARAGFLPLIVASAMVVCCAAALFIGLRKKTTTESPATQDIRRRTEDRSTTNVKAEIVLTAWFIGYMVMVYFIGFLFATLLWIIAYLKLHNVGWTRSIVISLVVVILLYSIFEMLFDVSLYKGVVPILYGFLP